MYKIQNILRIIMYMHIEIYAPLARRLRTEYISQEWPFQIHTTRAYVYVQHCKIATRSSERAVETRVRHACAVCEGAASNVVTSER